MILKFFWILEGNMILYLDQYRFDLRIQMPYRMSFKRAQSIDTKKRWTIKAFLVAKEHILLLVL